MLESAIGVLANPPEDKGARACAAGALAYVAFEVADRSILGPAVGSLQRTMAGDNKWARAAAAEALAGIAIGIEDEATLEAATEVLIPALQQDHRWSRRRAAKALEKIGTPKAKAALEEYRKQRK